MKLTKAFRESLGIYKKNAGDLLLALLLELVLRAAALTPLLFLASRELAPLAWLCVPAYLLIVLPARENYALALQDMLSGGRVFSLQLVSCEGYLRKLLRGLTGTGLMLLWAALPLAWMGYMWAMYDGLVDFFTMMRMLDVLGGGSSTAGIVRAVLIAVVLLVLPVIGCAVHSGARHEKALGAKLVRGRRLSVAALWMLGLVTLVPFAAVIVAAMGDYALSLIRQLKDVITNGLTFPALGVRVYVIIGAVVLLLLPALPLKNMLPAVYLRHVKEAPYMRGEEEKKHAAT